MLLLVVGMAEQVDLATGLAAGSHAVGRIASDGSSVNCRVKVSSTNLQRG